MKGIRRTLGTAPAQKAAALTDDIRAMVDATDAGMIGARDRALILLGFAGAFRRSELVGLDVGGLRFRQGWPHGHAAPVQNRSGGRGPQDRDTVRIESRDVPGSHGASLDGAGGHHQPGRCSGRSIGMGRCRPGRLSGIDVARVVKKLAERAGLDAAKYAGHSLRAGHATSCGHCGRFGAVHHEPDRASVGSDGAAVYPGWQSVPGEQRGEVGAVERLEGRILNVSLVGFLS